MYSGNALAGSKGEKDKTRTLQAAELLLSAGFSTLFVNLVGSSGNFSNLYDTLPQTFLTIGGPAAIGAMVVDIINPKVLEGGGLELRALVAGGIAMGALIVVGATPAVIDQSFLITLGLVSAGVYAGTQVAVKLFFFD